MAQVLSELVAKISADATELKKSLSDSEKKMQETGKVIDKETKSISERFKEIGKAAGIMGAAITASMGLMVKAAVDEEINIKRLAGTMANAGTEYDKVKDSLEALISTTQRKTGVADTEQRDILNRLILVTNDYNKALSLLPTVLDLAAVGSMDATTAATYLSKAYLELEEGAEQVSVRFGQASLQFKSMEDIQKRVAGSAENMKNPFKVLQATMGDLAEGIGTTLIPALKGIIDPLVDILGKVTILTQEQPELTKALAGAAVVVGILATAITGLAVAVFFLGAAFAPVAVAMLVVGGLTAAFIALKDTIWPIDDTVKILGATTKETAAIWEKELAKMKASAKKLYDEVVEKSDQFGDQIIKALQKKNEKEKKLELDKNQTLIDDSQKKTDSLIKNLERETRETISHYENMLTKFERSIDEQIRLENKRHNISIENWNEEEKNRLRDLRDKTKGVLSGLDTEIKAIRDAQDADDKRSQTEKDIAKREQYENDIYIAQREGNFLKATKIQRDLADFEKSLIARGTKETRQAEIDKLQIKKDAARDAAATTAEIISDSYKTVKKTEDKKVEKIIEGLQTVKKEQQSIVKDHIDDLTATAKTEEKTILASAKTEEDKLKTERETIQERYKVLNSDAVLQAEAVELALKTDQTELIALLTSYNPQWQDAGQTFGQKLLDGLNSMKEPISNAVDAILAKVGKAKSATEAYTIEQMVAESTAGAQAAVATSRAAQTGGFGFGGFGVTEFASGGIVTKPTLALVGEHGAEAITPLREAGGIFITFEGPVYGFKDFESKVAQAVKNHTIRGGFHGVLKGA